MTDYVYLEFANRVIHDGLDKLREAGCDRVLAVPGMLFAAMHAQNQTIAEVLASVKEVAREQKQSQQNLQPTFHLHSPVVNNVVISGGGPPPPEGGAGAIRTRRSDARVKKPDT